MSEPKEKQVNLIGAFTEALTQLPGVHVKRDAKPSQQPSHRIDAQIRLVVAQKNIELLLLVRKSLYPRDAREVLWQISSAQRKTSAEIHYVVLADSISTGAREILNSGQVGFFESGGTLSLPIAGAFIFIEKPPSRVHEKAMRSLFVGRRAHVLHALLAQHEEWLGVGKIAQLSSVAPSTASAMLAELERLDWLESRGHGPNKERHLTKPGEMLTAWATQLTNIPPKTQHRYYIPGMKPDAIVQRLDDVFRTHNVDYAIGHEMAAQRYAPFLSAISQVRVHLSPSRSSHESLEDLNARSVTEGANLIITETQATGELLFRQKLDGVWFASPIQVYLDLIRGEGRAKEMAEHLRKERIGF